ncbi:MAG TPA: MFS transporter [Chloroflexia bacterium]|nr:MFS transporter [Chloroflexia bacterium]
MIAVAESGPVPHLPRARRAVAACFALHGLIFASWLVRIPDVKAQLQLTDGQLGLALLGAPAGVVAGQVLAGWALPRWGSRRVTGATGVAWCASVPLLGAVPSVPALVLVLGLYGLTSAAMDVGMNAQAALVERHYGRPILSGFHGVWSVATLIGAAAGGVLAGWGVAVPLHFLAVAALALPGIVLSGRGLLEEPAAPAATAGSALAWALLPRRLLPLGALAFSVLVCEGAIGDWSAVYLREGLGSTSAAAASGYAVFSLLMAAGRLTGDWLTVRLGPAAVVRGGGLLVIAGILILTVAGTLPAAVVGFGLIGAGVACPFPLVISQAARTRGLAPGRAIAAMATVAYSGAFVGPPVIGTLAELITLRGALGVLGLVGVIMLLLGGTVQPPAPDGLG